MNNVFRKTVFLLLSIVVLAGFVPVAGTAVRAAGLQVQASIVAPTRTIVITGTGSSDPGSQVSIIILNPQNRIIYINQATAGEGGSFEHRFTLPVDSPRGSYSIRVGGSDASEAVPIGVVYREPDPDPDSGSDSDSDPDDTWSPGSSTPGGGPSGPSGPAASPAGPVAFRPDGSVTITPPSGAVTVEVGPGNRSQTVVTIPKDMLSQALAEARGNREENRISIPVAEGVDSARAVLPAGPLADQTAQGSNIIIRFQAADISYELPVNAIDYHRIAESLGASLEDIDIHIVMEKLDEASARSLGLSDAEELWSDPVQFQVIASAGGKEREIDDFGGVYISRTVALKREADPDKATGVWVDPATGKRTFVPTVFASENGRPLAEIKRRGNSLYAVVQHDRSFSDVPQGHWAKADIESLASKLVIDGMSETQFAPEEGITRAQFAALLVRSLGLAEARGNGGFIDVAADSWYAGAVRAASRHGIVTGFEDGTFAPDMPITRQEIAVMISGALRTAGKTAAASDPQQVLSDRFADHPAIADWARGPVAEAAAAGIVSGVSAGRFAPDERATRAQAAAMLKRMLKVADFIN